MAILKERQYWSSYCQVTWIAGSSQPRTVPIAGDRTQEHDSRRTREDDLETCGSYQEISEEWLVSPSPALSDENEEIEAQNADVADNGKPANPVSPRPEAAKPQPPERGDEHPGYRFGKRTRIVSQYVTNK